MLKKLLFRIVINSLAFYIAAWLFPRIQVNSWHAVVLTAFVLTLINLIIRPLLLLVVLPINFLTLGLFSLIINAWMVMLADKLVFGLSIPGLWYALVTSVIILFCNILFKPLIKGTG